MKLNFDSAALRAALAAGAGASLLREMALDHGINFGVDPAGAHWYYDELARDQKLGILAALGMDAAQSELVTVGNASIPAFLANFLDPRVIQILVSPMKAADIVGETQKGDWLTQTAMFLTAEATGEVSSYDDYSNSGSSNTNVNFPQRQNYVFQAFLQYGQRELGIAGLAKLDWASQQQQSNALTLMKALNNMYFFGTANLVNYGLLNDPALQPSITAQFAWLTNSSATAYTIYQDVVRMFQQLQAQTNGIVENDAPMTLALSPQQKVALKQITQFNTNSVEVLLKENFPNLKIETAVQYATPAGQLVQLIVNSLDGQKTAECAFSSKLMAHNMVVESSSWKQKRSSGGYGTIIYRPLLVVSMIA